MEAENTFENRIDLNPLKESVHRIRQELGKVIVGQSDMIDLLLTALLADGHVLLEGVPGVAKTMTAKLMAKAIDINFSRIQFTPDLMPSDVLGTSVFNRKTSEFEFKPGPVFSHIILIDEVNRAPAKTQAALFEVMEERQVTIDGKTYPMQEPYLVLATQNPIEQEGTYRLPEAQLDRFLFKIQVDYPNLEQEIEILNGIHQRKSRNELEMVQPVLSSQEIKKYRELIRQIYMEDHLIKYIARIVHKTRNHPDLFLGGSPRASIAIFTSAKAYAALYGRDFVTPDDIKKVTNPVLRHRIILTPEKEMEGIGPASLISQIVDSVEVPR
ncbi:MAG: AAA family ATPase [Candidatus Cyclobacteriaceae bacterium M3_2C_046]